MLHLNAIFAMWDARDLALDNVCVCLVLSLTFSESCYYFPQNAITRIFRLLFPLENLRRSPQGENLKNLLKLPQRIPQKKRTMAVKQKAMIKCFHVQKRAARAVSNGTVLQEIISRSEHAQRRLKGRHFLIKRRLNMLQGSRKVQVPCQLFLYLLKTVLVTLDK